jgi:hypothetical protein
MADRWFGFFFFVRCDFDGTNRSVVVTDSLGVATTDSWGSGGGAIGCASVIQNAVIPPTGPNVPVTSTQWFCWHWRPRRKGRAATRGLGSEQIASSVPSLRRDSPLTIVKTPVRIICLISRMLKVSLGRAAAFCRKCIPHYLFGCYEFEVVECELAVTALSKADAIDRYLVSTPAIRVSVRSAKETICGLMFMTFVIDNTWSES